MTDTTNREMLELAAKAAGMDDWRWHEAAESLCLYNSMDCCWYKDDNFVRIKWNPRHDNNDAFQLAARLKLQVAFGTFKDNTASAYKFCKPAVDVDNTDMEAAAREAIFLMAVEIGKGMK